MKTAIEVLRGAAIGAAIGIGTTALVVLVVGTLLFLLHIAFNVAGVVGVVFVAFPLIGGAIVGALLRLKVE